jgi:hypothetical protein
MGCGDEKLSKYLTQTFTAHCNAMICQQMTLSGDAEWPKVADAMIEALESYRDGFRKVSFTLHGEVILGFSCLGCALVQVVQFPLRIGMGDCHHSTPCAR